MLHWIHGMTGGSDVWRCVHRAGCDMLLFLRPSAHTERNEDRTTEVVAEQWHLAMWTLACWCVNHGRGHIKFFSGEAFVACPDCDTLLPLSDGQALTTGIIYFPRAGCKEARAPAYALHAISKTAFSKALNAARTACGGVRGYPLLRGMPCRLQVPFLHCTGTLAKVLTHFALACQPQVVQDEARQILLAITGKGKMDALYLREFRELVAHVAARPYIMSSDLDAVFLILFQLVQLVNASWRASLGDEEEAARRGAASITRLAASVLGPLFHEVKPLDPETKSSKTLSLYLHAPIAHLCHQVGANRLDVAFVADDAIEGHLRGVGRYMHNHGNNASQAALLSDFASVCEATVGFSTPRSDPSSLVYTKKLRVCSCWKTLGARGPADFDALKSIAENDPQLMVESCGGGAELAFSLPLNDLVDKNAAPRLDGVGKVLKGKKEALRRGLGRGQAVILACFCGRLTRQTPSRVMAVLRRRQDAERARAAAGDASEESATDANDGATTAGSGTDAAGTEEDAPTAAAAAPAGVAAPQAKRRDITMDARQSVPPMWLLRRCFSLPASYAAVVGVAPDVPEPSPSLVDAAFRQHIAVLRMFLMRTRTAEFARWTVDAKVDPADMVQAAQTMIERLSAMQVEHFSLVGGCEPMEL